MFNVLTFDDILREERARVRADVLGQIAQDIAHGLAPELAVASHVTDAALRTRLQQQLAAAAYLRKAGPTERLLAYPHDPFV